MKAIVALLGLASWVWADTSHAQAGLAGTWCGIAVVPPDSGLPVSMRLKIAVGGDSGRVALSLAESRLVDLAIPSPYSDSAVLSLGNDTVAFVFPPDIGLGILGNLGLSRDAERISFEGGMAGAELRGRLRITRYESAITLARGRCASRYREPEISFRSARDSLRLAGKLVLPNGKGPFPFIVFVTGSDPDTREAWQLEARALAARGIASLLYDKRGVGGSVGTSHDLASYDDLAGDVEGALRYLRSRADIADARRLGLAGQSQGTWVITKVAANDREIAFLVFISGGAMTGAEQETYRTGALMKRAGFTDADIAAARAFQREKFAVARTGLGWNRLDSTMQRLRADSVRWFPGYGTGAAARSLAVLRLYGVLQFNYDPVPDLGKIKVPTLVIMGENDVVFPPDTVISRMRGIYRRSGNTKLTTRILPRTSHGQLVRQYVGGDAFRWVVNPAFLETLTSWVATHSRVAR
jgi:pimeloyl-ACP methyl ester carboxylesterase